jgi:ATP-dependent DNA helicase RecG
MDLRSKISENFRLNEYQKKALGKLGIAHAGDLLWHFPSRYGDTANVRSIASVARGDDAVLFGKVTGLKTSKGFRTKIAMAKARLTDESGSIGLVWFNQPYIAKMVAEGALVRVEGKISQRMKKKEGAEGEAEMPGDLYLSNPKIEPVDKLPLGVGDNLFGDEGTPHTLYPVYPESQGVTSNWFFHAIQRVFKSGILDNLVDPIPEHILTKYNLPGLKTALVWIHAPQKQDHADAARKRFAFEEVFLIQLKKRQERLEYQQNPAFKINKTTKEMEDFISRFPFAATDAQRKAVSGILADFGKGHPMSRLLHGDVGSGKTAVAAATAYAAVSSRPMGQTFGTLQVAYMCPTEILATQHFESFVRYFAYLGVNVALITGSGCKKFPSKVNPKGWTDISRTQLLKWVASGEIAVVVGTHALIQKAVKFKHLAYVIIDEQHRFGTAQRRKLVTKEGMAPHLLSMTATPIPRTMALTIYGDLDLTLLDQMPEGRKKINTEIVLPGLRESVYEKIRAQLKEGRQAYVICPRIDEPDPDKEQAVNAKSVTAEAKRLKRDVFQEFSIGVLHGKMTPAAKDKAMREFYGHQTDILVATSVVEVGVNVPNATVIVIEGGERFGLSQLHQLRGRVVRGTHEPFCYVFSETKTAKTLERLTALKTAKNGFELAEADLAQRGAGELYSGKQWGLTDVAMEALKNIKMVEAARTEAISLIEADPTLSRHPLLKDRVDKETELLHFE